MGYNVEIKLGHGILGVLKKSFVSFVHTLVSFVFNFKSLKHKGSQRASQRNTKVKAAFG